MYRPFFIGSNWDEYLAELKSWNGTKYWFGRGDKGRGCDCSHFICSALKNIGVLKKVEYQYYARDWHIHTNSEFVLKGILYYLENHLAKNLCCIEVKSKEPEDFIHGDMLTFSTSSTGVSNHSTIWIGDWPETKERFQMYNAISRRGVCRITWGSYWKKRNTKIYRFMEEV